MRCFRPRRASTDRARLYHGLPGQRRMPHRFSAPMVVHPAKNPKPRAAAPSPATMAATTQPCRRMTSRTIPDTGFVRAADSPARRRAAASLTSFEINRRASTPVRRTVPGSPSPPRGTAPFNPGTLRTARRTAYSERVSFKIAKHRKSTKQTAEQLSTSTYGCNFESKALRCAAARGYCPVQELSSGRREL